MLQSRGLALKDRITFNDKLLDQYRDRVAQLTAAHSQAQKRFVTAQTELAIATTELDDTLAHYQSLRDETDELRSSLMTTPLPTWLMQTFPEELLRAIFLRALQVSGGWEPVMTWADAFPRMEAPFILASVCRRWRSIAVDSPDLWTFICPPPVRAYKMHLTVQCTQLLLLRSCSAPLDVACLYPSNEVFTIVFEHCERVRKLVLNVGQMAIKSTLDRIRFPMPLLEHISLLGDPLQAEGEWPHPRYLTFAPALRVFESQLRNVFLAAPRPPLNHLRILRVVFNTTPLHVILDSLRLVPDLEELQLHIHSAPAPTVLPQTLVGVSLKGLTVLEYGLFNDSVRQFAALIDAPALRSLTVQMRLLPDDNMDAVLNRMSDSLTALTINDGRLDVDSLPILRALKCLEVLAIKSSTCIADAFFHAIAEDPLCFPRLRAITLADTACIEPDDGGGLETLLRERNGTGTKDVASSSPSRITEVALSSTMAQGARTPSHMIFMPGWSRRLVKCGSIHTSGLSRSATTRRATPSTSKDAKFAILCLLYILASTEISVCGVYSIIKA